MLNKVLILILTVGILQFPCGAKTIKQYDKYGRQIGSYKQTSTGYVSQDKYNRINGYYRQHNNSMVKYDKYNRKQSIHKHPR